MTPTKRIQRWLSSALMATSLFAASCAHADSLDNLALEMSELAKAIAKLLEERGGERQIVVGQFTPPPRLATSTGPAVARSLKEALKKQNIQPTTRARHAVEGKYRTEDDSKSGLLVVKVEADVSDENGKSIQVIRTKVFGTTAVAVMAGATVELPPNAEDAVRDKRLRERIAAPKAHAAGAAVSTAAASPYGVEILLVGSGGKLQPMTAQVREGMAFVELKRNDSFAVRLINRSDHDAAVVLTVDGLSAFTFSKRKDYTHFIVDKKSELIVRGWHEDNRTAQSFKVVEQGRSAVAEIGANTANVGVVTATFAAAWGKDFERPLDEPKLLADARAGNAIGKGPRIAQKLEEVSLFTGVVRAVVSVRYDR